jgi:hypothetical protein
MLGSRVRHDAPGALRGLFFLVGMLLALRGLFFLVDMSLPVVHSAVTSPLLPFFLMGPLSLSLVVFLLSRSVQSAPSSLSGHSVTVRLLGSRR